MGMDRVYKAMWGKTPGCPLKPERLIGAKVWFRFMYKYTREKEIKSGVIFPEEHGEYPRIMGGKIEAYEILEREFKLFFNLYWYQDLIHFNFGEVRFNEEYGWHIMPENHEASYYGFKIEEIQFSTYCFSVLFWKFLRLWPIFFEEIKKSCKKVSKIKPLK
jgi:hypothetical protein